MSEQVLSTEQTRLLGEISQRIDELLNSVQPISDGTNRNTFDSKDALDGYEIGLSKSEKPDGHIGYNVRKKLPPNEAGDYESWEYRWGDCEPHVIYARSNVIRIFSSHIHPDDVLEGRSLGTDDFDAARMLVQTYDNITGTR